MYLKSEKLKLQQEKPIKETTHHWPCCLIDEGAAQKHCNNERLKPKMKTKRIKMENLMDFPFYSEKVDSVKSVQLPC